MTEGTPDISKEIEEKPEVQRKYTPIELAIISERVRIWNAIFTNSSVQPWIEGSKRTLIITIGEPTLREIILPSGMNPNEPDFDPEHKSNKPLAKAIDHDENQK